MKTSKAVKFADDLLLGKKTKLYGWPQIFRTFEMSKVTAWSRENESRYKEDKYRVMII